MGFTNKERLAGFYNLALSPKKEYYGYELIRDINKFTEMDLSEGTIYPLLNRLKKEELISSNWVEMETGIPRKYYHITPKGREAMKTMKNSWIQITNSIQDLMVKK